METTNSMLWLFRDSRTENGNYYSMLGLFRDNGEENGNLVAQV